jgi:6-phosphogluconolactonase (cycloisomerase 2 family)
MKLNTMGRAGLASVLSLAMIGVTACSRDYVLAYLYVTTAKPLASGSNNGGISAFAIDFQSGALSPLSDSPIPAGDDPVALVASPNSLYLYVVNQNDSDVMVYQIGTDGKLYNQQTVNVTGSTPTAVAVDAAGAFLYVTFRYQLGPSGQQLYSPASPGPGGVTIFPISSSNGQLGTPSTVLVGNNPVGIVVSKPQINTPPAGYVYVIDQETQANGSPIGVALGFSENLTTGALTPVPGTVITTPPGGKTVATGYGAGTTPSAIAEDPSARFVYVTDQASNQLYGYLASASGALTPMPNAPFATGLFPDAVTVDPRGKYLYVANYSSQTVSAYAINEASGTPTGSQGSSSTATTTGPTCVTIEPALGIYLYTSDSLASDVTALQLNANNGSLQQVINTPFPTSGLPTCAVTVSNGSHPTQLINP